MRICIWRMGFAGDVLFSTAALEGIKKKYPRSHLTYGVWPAYAPLVELDPHIDDFAYDDASLERAKKGADRAWEISHEKYPMPEGEMVYWGEIHARQAAELGLLCLEDMESFKPRIYLDPSDAVPLPDGPKIAALGVFSKNGADARLWGTFKAAEAHGFAGLPPGDFALDGRCWPALVKALQKMGFTCVQLGGKEDPRVRGAVDLCGRLSWRQSVGIVMQADVCITIDSFLLHAAVAEKRATDGSVLSEGTPTVALLGPTDSRAMFPADAERVAEVHARPKWKACPCFHSARFGQGTCEYGNSCMKDVTVEQILKGVERALDGAGTDLP